ncbi:carbonic anhydrase [Larkinella rosea]|uniref:carbonic anhydrase n=1 Tax=Larkinella rosea TaxID=2025312 RepID=A0A3P1BTC2_9BACT|nr:carbonic anhydrase family protein [Larkinella rosea]RRB04351.1 carbonic anhydrase family protein [Larkinella rosea]
MNQFSIFKVIVIVLAVSIGSCSKNEDVVTPEVIHWNYEHPEWQTQGFSECAGTIQSPVDIQTTNTIKVDLPNLVFNYSAFPIKIIDNGHTLQVNNNGTNSVTYNGKTYAFKQFHFHYHSEHLLDGVASDMELHLVHQDPASGALLVVGYFLKKGAANPVFESVFSNWPKQKETEVTTTTSINLTTLLPVDKRYYTYIGSLTTPPCSQGVTFFIMKTPLEVSGAQIDQFKAHYDHNARPVQSLNSRLMYEDIL